MYKLIKITFINEFRSKSVIKIQCQKKPLQMLFLTSVKKMLIRSSFSRASETGIAIYEKITIMIDEVVIVKMVMTH